MNPKIRYDNLVRQLLPPHRRQPVRMWILRTLIWPLVVLYDEFVLWRDDVRMRLNLTSQVMVLEGYLRLKYDPTLTIKIVTYKDGLLAVGLRFEGRIYHPAIGLKREKTVGIPLRSEKGENLGDYDFLVIIPPGVDPALIRAEIERYRQAGVKYKIIQNEA